MKKISALSLLAVIATILPLSGCKRASAGSDESSDISTINISPSSIVISVNPTQPEAQPSDSEQISEVPSEPEDTDDDAYYTYLSKGAGVMIIGGENEREKIRIPAAINERTVVAVSGSAKKSLFPKAKSIELPDTLEDIYNYAFAGCSVLTDIKIPNGVGEIGEYAFKDCISLQELLIPSSVEEIEANAFEGCISLSRLTISDGVKTIRTGAFSGCTSLTEIALPDSVTTVNWGAFDTNVDFTVTYKDMTFNPYNINDLYTLLS